MKCVFRDIQPQNRHGIHNETQQQKLMPHKVHDCHGHQAEVFSHWRFYSQQSCLESITDFPPWIIVILDILGNYHGLPWITIFSYHLTQYIRGLPTMDHTRCLDIKK